MKLSVTFIRPIYIRYQRDQYVAHNVRIYHHVYQESLIGCVGVYIRINKTLVTLDLKIKPSAMYNSKRFGFIVRLFVINQTCVKN